MTGAVNGDSFNASTYLVDRNLADRGEHVAVIGPGGGLTYRELAAGRDDVAAGLLSLGLRRDDRVMMVMSDDLEMFEAILACFHAGLVAVPVSTMLGGEELGMIAADSGARALIFTREYGAVVTQALALADDLEFLIGVDTEVAVISPAVRQLGWTEMVRSGGGWVPSGPATTSPDSWALWLYTSGTTGRPKAAMHRHANIRYVCETYGAQVLRITPGDICLSVAKLFFAYGIGNSLFFPLSVGATALLEPRRPTPAVMAERTVAGGATLFFGVPTFFAALVASDIGDDTFSGVRLATSAGEALPAELQRRFTTRFGLDVIDGIGSTEMLHIFLSNDPGDIHPGSTGRAVPGYDLELRDEMGAQVPVGTSGVLYVRGESAAIGYWRRTDATREVFQGNWVRTGDTYLQDEAGYYICLGRANDLLKAGGIWVSPAEVESRLLAHDAVAEVAVVGVSDADGLDKPVACVVLAAGLVDVTEADLITWCREGLAAFKRPRAVVFVDALPKTATGKVQRFRNREQVAALGPSLGTAGSGRSEAKTPEVMA